MNPSQEQQKKWGRDLAAEMGSWPRLQQLAEDVGIAADPAELIPTLVNQDNRRQTAPLAAFFTLIENAMAHHANQADADNQEWQSKVTALQIKVDTLTTALTQSVNGSRSGRRISEDPDKFGGTEKDVTKRQQQYVTWRSQIQRCFGMDEHIFNTEFRRIQHIAGLLKDDAYDLFRIHFETITDDPLDPSKWHWQTHVDVFKTLNDQYATLDLSRQAGIDFDNLWMTNKPFQNFIAEFNKLATKSGRTDVQKVETLKIKVSQELSDVAMNRSDKPGPADFEGWCKLFQNIYQDLQEKDHLDKLRNNRPSARRTPAISTQPSSQYTQPTINPTIIPTTTNADDPMVLDARFGPRPSREQCIHKGLCFYCKKPGHNKDGCEEKRRNDAKFGRLTHPYQPAFQTAALSQAGRGMAQAYLYPQHPMAQRPRPPQLQPPQSSPYHLRVSHDGTTEEVASVMSSSPTPSAFAPSPTATSIGASNNERSENGSPLI